MFSIFTVKEENRSQNMTWSGVLMRGLSKQNDVEL